MSLAKGSSVVKRQEPGPREGAGRGRRPKQMTLSRSDHAEDALARLEDLAMEAIATPPRRLIEATVDLVVFIARTDRGRQIAEIVAHERASRRIEDIEAPNAPL